MNTNETERRIEQAALRLAAKKLRAKLTVAAFGAVSTDHHATPGQVAARTTALVDAMIEELAPAPGP